MCDRVLRLGHGGTASTRSRLSWTPPTPYTYGVAGTYPVKLTVSNPEASLPTT